MPLPRRTPAPPQRTPNQGTDDAAATGATAGVIAVASCVWSQYFPQDHYIGIARPGDTRDASYYSLVSDSEGRFKAAVAFQDCFRDLDQWAPLLMNVRCCTSLLIYVASP